LDDFLLTLVPYYFCDGFIGVDSLPWPLKPAATAHSNPKAKKPLTRGLMKSQKIVLYKDYYYRYLMDKEQAENLC
jgi:hypothetical protein